MEKLKPCPFCGGEADYYPADPNIQLEYEAERWGNIWVQCMECGASTIECDSFAEASEKWNRRADNE